MPTDSLPLLDVRIADLGRADGIGGDGPTMVERDEPWVYDLGDVDGHHIVVATNTDEQNTIGPGDCMELDLEPLRMVLWDNGWLAYLGPGNDRHVGTRECEDRWIDALEAEVAELGGDLTPEEVGDGE